MAICFVPTRFRSFKHIAEHNWLIHSLMIEYLREMAPEYASGQLVDIGCGTKPYEAIFARFVDSHIGVDLESSPHGVNRVDVIGSAYDTTLATNSCDTILCTEVLEHLEEPQLAIREMNRILTDGGTVVVTVPLFWPVHELPRDFYRFTEFGLRYIFESNGFDIVNVVPLTGYIATFAQLTVYQIRQFQKYRLIAFPTRLTVWLVQKTASYLNQFDKSYRYTNLYGLVAQKRIKEPGKPRFQA